MKSLELNRAYYRDCVSKIISEQCPDIAEKHAAALIGYGSEVLGNDDEFSKRYGWGPRLLLFLTQKDHRQWGYRLLEILQKNVPLTFLGHPTRYTEDGPPQPTQNPKAPIGIAITTCKAFLELYLGISRTDLLKNPLPSKEWLLINESQLLRLVSGEVYYDGMGTLTHLREYFSYFPDDVWRYKLAYQWSSLSWDIDLIGYCARRGDALSARIAAARSAERIIGLVFLLNKVYQPGYLKWVHRQFYKLPNLAAEIGPVLEKAMTDVDCGNTVLSLYPVLDRLIEYQSSCLGIPVPDYKKPPKLDAGFFKYSLDEVICGIRDSIHGELAALPTTIGAVDQWIADQDLLMVPLQLNLLKPLYDCEDPAKMLFNRSRLEDKGI
jgi:hypothetical protein